VVDKVEEDEEDDDNATIIGECPPKLVHSPMESDDAEDHTNSNRRPSYAYHNPVIDMLSNMLPSSGDIFYQELMTINALTRQQHAPINPNLQDQSTLQTNIAYEIDTDEFERDCERFLEVVEEGDLDEMKVIVQRYQHVPIYRLRLVNTIHEEVSCFSLSLSLIPHNPSFYRRNTQHYMLQLRMVG
jgi:hypothetical protein